MDKSMGFLCNHFLRGSSHLVSGNWGMIQALNKLQDQNQQRNQLPSADFHDNHTWIGRFCWFKSMPSEYAIICR